MKIMKKMKNDKNYKIKLVFLWVFAFFVITFLMCMRTYAAGTSTLLPYYISDANYDTSTFENLKQQQVNWWGYVVFDFSYDNIIAYKYEEYGIEFIRFYGFSNSDYTVSLTEPWDSFTDSGVVNLNLSSCSRLTIRVVPDNYGNVCYGYDYPSNITVGFSDLENFPFEYLNNIIWTPSYNNADGKMVFTNVATPIIDYGSAIIPGPFIIPEYLTGQTAPDKVPPTFTPNNYTWTQKPSFDNSSVINAIQSIKDTLDWLSDNLKNEISNLTSNIGGFFKYIGDTIQYYGNAIISSINNGIQTLYNNFKALIEPLYNKFSDFYNDFMEFADLFINPFDQEEFDEQIENCQLISQYNELMENCEDLRAIFNNAVERDYFVLYIDFENPFADSEHKIIHSEISFTWLKDYRSIYRPFLWVFTMIECFVGGMRLLGGIIGGKAK